MSRLLRRAPRIEMDHKAAAAADLIIGFVIGRPDSQRTGRSRDTNFNRYDDNYYYLRRIVVLPPRLLD